MRSCLSCKYLINEDDERLGCVMSETWTYKNRLWWSLPIECGVQPILRFGNNCDNYEHL